jgi:hypothetical protein
VALFRRYQLFHRSEDVSSSGHSAACQGALRPLEHDPEKWVPVFGKACPGRDPGIMLKQQAKAKCRFNLKSFRFSNRRHMA